MNFEKYINEAWANHATQYEQVSNSYTTGCELVLSEKDMLSLARLVVHIASDHDFKFHKAIDFLEHCKKQYISQSEEVQKVLKRQISTLKYIENQDEDISTYSASDRVVIFATTASSLFNQGQVEKAQQILNNSIAATHRLTLKDPALASLAATCNNMAASLEEKSELNDFEKKFMIDVAQYAYLFWEKVGTWMNIERAEYRLSQCYKKISDFDNAEKHAQICLEICKKENADSIEMFFAYEALASIYKLTEKIFEFETSYVGLKTAFNESKESDQSWLKPYLDKLA